MFKVNKILTYSACIMMLSAGLTSSVSAGTTVAAPSADAVVFTKPTTSTACISCRKQKLKTGMWQIGIYR